MKLMLKNCEKWAEKFILSSLFFTKPATYQRYDMDVP